MYHNHLQYGDAAIDEDLVTDVRLLLHEDAIAAASGDLMAARVGHRVIPADGGVPGEGDEIKNYDSATFHVAVQIETFIQIAIKQR